MSVTNEVTKEEEEIGMELAGADEELREKLAQYTLEGNWVEVKKMYRSIPKSRTITVNNSEDTALHVAVDLDEENVVKDLVSIIVEHEKSALKIGNKHGDTPLHVAASRGFARLCKCIIGENEERIELRTLKNNNGETPLFLAALNGNKKAFAYLSQTFHDRHQIILPHLVRDHDQDSILHCVIGREYFDLAVIIADNFPMLTTLRNKDGFTPLKVLATRPSAFPSGIKFSWWKRILYHCILIEPLNAEHRLKKIREKMEAKSEEKFPKNYATLWDFIRICWWEKDQEADIEKSIKNDDDSPFYPPNYETVLQIISSIYVLVFGLHGVAVKEIRKTKKKHKWSGQLLDALMERPYEAFAGKAGERPDPRGWDIQPEVYDIGRRHGKQQGTDDEETPFLLAARNGIVEMVVKIRRLIPSVIHNTNSKKENVVLVAVKHRQPHVVEALKTELKDEVWNTLIQAVDDDDNTLLHLAAQKQVGSKPWNVAGTALEMMWDIKWYQYMKKIVPRHCHFRSNKDSKTAGQIFNTSHQELIQEASQWLKDTSESCSVVAALVAGVSFATAGNVPGGYDNGEPPLEGQPAFEVFALASLVGLCFSVTGLIMFLSILTSRKVAKDFRRSLPLKLLAGLSSLFVSIITMFVSFCSGHFFLVNHKYKSILFPLYAATSIPVAFYALAQFPLYFDLLRAILTTVPTASDVGEIL
ncbi:hypothetical protein AHAS_Ahas17G0060200 [Arachis hypogaea]